jgi:L-fuconolactonase
MRIDAHQHFWLPDRIEYAWMKPLTGEAARRLVRPVLPPELEPILAQHGIEQTVLVQAAINDDEADFLLELAQSHDFIAGAVVWLDMEREDFEVQLSKRAEHPKFLGVRPMVENIADPRWMLRPAVLRAFRALEERGTCFDFLLKHHQLPAALEVLVACPRLHAVVDHIAKPLIREGVLEPWGSLLAQVAEHPNVYCKLSGMITEADHERWAPEDLGPYIERALRAFGPARCMFGSDWPVCTLAGSYDQVLHALQQHLARLGVTAPELRRIFGETACEFYRLPAPAQPASQS